MQLPTTLGRYYSLDMTSLQVDDHLYHLWVVLSKRKIQSSIGTGPGRPGRRATRGCRKPPRCCRRPPWCIPGLCRTRLRPCCTGTARSTPGRRACTAASWKTTEFEMCWHVMIPALRTPGLTNPASKDSCFLPNSFTCFKNNSLCYTRKDSKTLTRRIQEFFIEI